MEVGSGENARGFFDYLSSIGVKMFAQKIGWKEVRSLRDMPTAYSYVILLYPDSQVGKLRFK